MLALKKKREAEAKAAAEAPPAAQEPAPSTEKVSLLGIGGKKKTKSGDNNGSKKRTPGEIRIQKGSWLASCCLLLLYRMACFLLYLILQRIVRTREAVAFERDTRSAIARRIPYDSYVNRIIMNDMHDCHDDFSGVASLAALQNITCSHISHGAKLSQSTFPCRFDSLTKMSLIFHSQTLLSSMAERWWKWNFQTPMT